MKTKKIFIIVINILLIGFFMFSLFFAAVSIFLKVSDKNADTLIFGWGFFEVVTDSMEPEIRVGEVIIVKRTDPSKLVKDDVITFWYKGNINTHKIVSIEENSVITRGVNTPANDDPVPFDDIIGKVVAHSNALGALFGFLRTWYGFIILIIIPAFILLGYETYVAGLKLQKYKNKKIREAGLQKEIEAVQAEIARLEEKNRECGVDK